MKTWQRLLGAGTVIWAVAESQCTPAMHNPLTDSPDLAVAKNDLSSGVVDMAVGVYPDLYMTPLALTAVSPALGTSLGGIPLTLTGTAFVNGVTVTIGDKPATVTQTTSTQLTVTLPASPLTKGKVPITIRNPDGTQVIRADLFSYYYGTVKFSAELPVAVGSNPYAVAIGELNNNAKPDLVVANYFANSVGVLLGNADGTFATMASYSTGATSRPKGIALGDFNNDMYPDVVAVNFSTYNVSVFLNDKNGVLGTKTDYSTGTAPLAVAAGDVNNDGFAEVVTANSGSKNGSYFRNTAGTLSAGPNLTASTSPSAVIMADVNNDKYPDIIIANQSTGDCSVYLNDGKGVFTAKGPYFAGTAPVGVAVADIDGDGKVDLIVSLSGDNKVAVLKGDQDGFFNTPTTYSVGMGPAGIATADFNGDGRADIATVLNVEGTVAILLNANGVPSPANAATTLTAGSQPLGIAVGDLNNDGRPDVVVANSGGSNAVGIPEPVPIAVEIP